MIDKTPNTDQAPQTTTRRIPVVFGAIAVGAVIGFAGVYGIGGLKRNGAGDPACWPAVELAKRIAPLARGEVAALTMASTPLKIPDLTFEDGLGSTRTLSEWRGKTVLVNLWATWCIPCRKEMPALDTLQAKLGGPNFEVIPINIDTRDMDKPKTWLKDAGLSHLNFFSDKKANVFQHLNRIGRALGMPTSVLIDGAGCEIATLAGPAEWSSEDAVKLIAASLAK